MSKLIEWGSKKFCVKNEHGSDPYVFRIDDHWMFSGYRHPVRYRSSSGVEVMDWCTEHAPNAHLHHQEGRAMLFKDENTAMMFKLTFSE